MDNQKDTIIIVEGKTDKARIKEILIDDDIDIICTNGTLGIEKLDELVLSIEDKDVFILVDEDNAGHKMRSILKQELPNAEHLYTLKIYKQVAETPFFYLARIFMNAGFDVDKNKLALLAELGEE